MRTLLLSALAVSLVAGSAVGAWPASKSYQANDLAPKLVSDPNGDFPGWGISESQGDWNQTAPGTVAGLDAEMDVVAEDTVSGTDGKLKYSTGSQAAWTFVGGQDVTTAIIWRVYIASATMTTDNHMPALQIGNGTTRYRLDFHRNVADPDEAPDCQLSGWIGSDGTDITDGGKVIPNSTTGDLYLPMTMDEWHTIRFEVGPDGLGGSKFEAWLDEDEGLSDELHISGGSTKGSTSAYVQWGVISSINGSAGFATNFIAWGQNVPGNADEIEPLPSVPMEICGNGLDDDGDGDADCYDSQCDCSPIPPDCGATTEIIERFNVGFVGAATGNGFVPPGWDRGGYNTPAYTDWDPAADPGYSMWTLSPDDPSDDALAYCDQILADCLDVCAGDPTCEQQCNYEFLQCVKSKPFHVGLPFDLIATDCGNTQSCYEGSIQVVIDGVLNDLVTYPVDWTKPVTITASSAGRDASGPIDPVGGTGIGDGSAGTWETFIAYAGYTASSTLTTEWGVGGDHLNAQSRSDYVDVSFVIDLTSNPADVTEATLAFGVNFDYWDEGLAQPVQFPTDKTSEAYFENIRVTYTIDTTAAELTVAPDLFQHNIGVNQSLSNDIFNVTNSGGGDPLTYTITETSNWLSVAPTSGSLASLASDAITITYDTAQLQLGMNTASITVESPEAYNSPLVVEVAINVDITPPDYDNDGDVDQEDFGIWQDCFTGANETPQQGLCASYADLDGEGDVDQDDFIKFQACASGPEIPFDTNCLNN